MTEKERRRFLRAVMMLGINIDDGKEVFRADVLDLTVHGMSFKLGRKLEPGDEFHVDIPATRNIKGARLKARALKCEKSQEGGKFVVRAEFLEPDDEYLMDILAVVNSLHSSA